MNNFQLKKLVAERFYEKYQELSWTNVRKADPSMHEVIEDMLDNILQEKTSIEDPKENLYCNILKEIAKKEISTLEKRLGSFKRKLEMVEKKNWKKIKIQDDFYYVRDHDNFAYRFQCTQTPVYMYNGRNWVKLASDHHIIDISQIDDF